MNSTTVLSSHPVAIYRDLDIEFRDAPWMLWDADTILKLMDKVTEPRSRDKLMAVCRSAGNMNIVCTQAIAFEKICHAFCNNPCVMDMYQPLFIEEVHYAVEQLHQLQKILDPATPLEFAGEVPGYVASVAEFRNVNVLPKPLEFAQDTFTFLSRRVPTPDEITLMDNMDSIYRTSPEDMKDFTTIDAIVSRNNIPDGLKEAAVFLLGCYAFDPTIAI